MAGNGRKRAKFWAVRRRGGPASDGLEQSGPRIRTNNNHNNHNNHNTARSGVEVKPRISVAPKGVEEGGRGGEGGPKVGVPKGGPQRAWLPLTGFRVWVWEGLGSRSECKSLGFGFGLCGVQKI